MPDNFDRRNRTGWEATPHGLWTAPGLTYAERCLLGWLHSHEQSYLQKLSVSRVEREFGGGGSTKDWLAKLEGLGYLTKIKDGNRWVIDLDVDAYRKLDRPPAEPAPAVSAKSTRPNQLDNPAETAPVVHQREDQEEDRSLRSRAAAEPAAARAPREALYEALCEVCSMDYSDMPPRNRRQVGVVVSELLKVEGACAEEVRRRASLYRQTFQAALTPNALLNQWALLREPPPLAAPPPRESPGRAGVRKVLDALRDTDVPAANVVPILRTGT